MSPNDGERPKGATMKAKRMTLMLAITLAACGGGDEAGDGGGTQTATATETPAGGASAKLTLTAPVGASDDGFAETTLSAPADTPLAIAFNNKDDTYLHNVSIYTDETAETSLFGGEDTTGPKKITYEVPALDAGTYFFRCDVHPTRMTGTVEVA
jgi:plastocyanin